MHGVVDGMKKYISLDEVEGFIAEECALLEILLLSFKLHYAIS